MIDMSFYWLLYGAVVLFYALWMRECWRNRRHPAQYRRTTAVYRIKQFRNALNDFLEAPDFDDTQWGKEKKCERRLKEAYDALEYYRDAKDKVASDFERQQRELTQLENFLKERTKRRGK